MRIIQTNTYKHVYLFTYKHISLHMSMIVEKWNLKPRTLYKGPHPEYDGKPTLESVRKPVSRISKGSFSWQRKLLSTTLRLTSITRRYWWSNTLEGNGFSDPNSVSISKFPFKKWKVGNKSNVSFDLVKSHTICKRTQPPFWLSYGRIACYGSRSNTIPRSILIQGRVPKTNWST